MSGDFDLGQVCQLREIDEAMKKRRGRSIGPYVQMLINRLTSGGVAGGDEVDYRRCATKVLWDLGFGAFLGYDQFDDYLGSVPQIPSSLDRYSGNFPHIVLVDGRLCESDGSYRLHTICNLCGVKYSLNESLSSDRSSDKHPFQDVYWMRCTDGKSNRGVRGDHYVRSLTEDQLGLNALEGLMMLFQVPEVFGVRYVAKLPGSIYGERGELAAAVAGPNSPELMQCRLGQAGSIMGVATRALVTYD